MLLKTFTITLLLLITSPAFATEPDWKDYEGLLHDYVHTGTKNGVTLNLVSYQQWNKDKRWPKVLKQLETFELKTLEGKNETLAFWINSYNILAIHTVLKNSPLDSIRDAGNFFNPVWEQDAAVVAGQMRTLEEVEHKILRPMGEPRIHFSIVCASVSCPDLRMEAYTSAKLENQLSDQTLLFLTNKQKGLAQQGSSINVSKIFNWFQVDFQQGDVTQWLKKHDLQLHDNVSINEYLDYDWNLNGG